MIDGFQLLNKDISEKEWLNIPFIEWSQKTNLKTGEMIYPIEGKYKTLDIKIHPKRREINGSLHKFWNAMNDKGNQNFDDFTFTDLQKALVHLQKVFKLDPEKTNVENLEYGLNINIDYSPETILTRNLIVWKDLTPSKNLSFNNKGKFLEFERDRYSLKVYDKGKQNHLNESLIRIEVKALEYDKCLQNHGIRTLKDLNDLQKLESLFNDLKETFSSCVIVDDLSGNQISNPKEKNDFKDGINPLTWSSYETDPAGRQRKSRLKKRFFRILEKYQLNTIKNHILTRLQEKGESILKCHKWDEFQQTPETTIPEIYELPKNGNMSQMEPYIYGPFVTLEKCIITGVNISHQTTNKIYILESTIKEISQTDPETFNKLIKEYKTANWENYSLEKNCKEIAHGIRRNIQTLKEKITKYQNSLFPLDFTQGLPDKWKIN